MTSPTDAPSCIAAVDDVDMHSKFRKVARDTLSTLVDVFTSKDNLVADSPVLAAAPAPGTLPPAVPGTSGGGGGGGGGGGAGGGGSSGAVPAAPSARRGARRRRAARRPGYIVLYSSSDDRFDTLALK